MIAYFERDVLPFNELKASKDVSEVLKLLHIASSLLYMAYSIPTRNNYTIDLTSSKEMCHVAEKFIIYFQKLMLQLEMDERLSSVVYLPNNSKRQENQIGSIEGTYLQKCDIFIAFISSAKDTE